MTTQQHVETLFSILEDYGKRERLGPTEMQHLLQHTLACWVSVTASHVHGDNVQRFEQAVDRASRTTEKLIRDQSMIGRTHGHA